MISYRPSQNSRIKQDKSVSITRLRQCTGVRPADIDEVLRLDTWLVVMNNKGEFLANPSELPSLKSL